MMYNISITNNCFILGEVNIMSSNSLIGNILHENNPQSLVSKIVESTAVTSKEPAPVPAIATNEDPNLTTLIPKKETDPDELLNRGLEIIENLGVSDCILSLTFLDTYFSAMVCNNALSIGEKFTLKDMFLEKLGYPIEFSNK